MAAPSLVTVFELLDEPEELEPVELEPVELEPDELEELEDELLPEDEDPEPLVLGFLVEVAFEPGALIEASAEALAELEGVVGAELVAVLPESITPDEVEPLAEKPAAAVEFMPTT
jgi:hypothetical protein